MMQARNEPSCALWCAILLHKSRGKHYIQWVSSIQLLACIGPLTNHEVGDNTVYAKGKDPEWNQICQNFGQKECGHTIVATGVLMAVRIWN